LAALDDIVRTYANHGFLSFVGDFSPSEAKNHLQKKKSTMPPQATAAFAQVLIVSERFS
jgi:hypothetical protein